MFIRVCMHVTAIHIKYMYTTRTHWFEQHCDDNGVIKVISWSLYSSSFAQARSLRGTLNQSGSGGQGDRTWGGGECPVMDIIDKATPGIIKRYITTLSPKERVRLLNLTRVC